MVKRLRDNGIVAQSEALFGHVIDEIVKYADKNKVDLIVIATHGHSGVGSWVFGSDAERILRSAHVPVLMVRVASYVTLDV